MVSFCPASACGFGDVAGVRRWSVGAVFNAVASQLHEGGFEARATRRELVQGDTMHRGELADAGGVHTRDEHAAVLIGLDRGSGRFEKRCERGKLG